MLPANPALPWPLPACSLQEIVDDSNLITITPQNQHNPGMQIDDEEQKEYQARASGGGGCSSCSGGECREAGPGEEGEESQGLGWLPPARLLLSRCSCGEAAAPPRAPAHAALCSFPPPAPQVKFGQIYLSKPTFVEADGETAVLFPKEARLRNLTYAAPLYVDLEKKVVTKGPEGEPREEEVTKYEKIFLGDVSARSAAQHAARRGGGLAAGPDVGAA